MFSPCCKSSDYTMSKTQNIVLRVTIVMGMMVAVVAVLYLSPLPDQSFKSCDRPCHDLDWPMICRIKMEISHDSNSTESQVISVNGRSPGAPIQVCQNDVLVVDVVNKIPGHGISVHWRGQQNSDTPFMDGVPLITQCPITSYTAFQYKFRATVPGTHLYHAFSHADRSKGLFGALIVRQPHRLDPQRKLYDFDAKSHTVLVSESGRELLINGKSPSETGAALSIFNVRRNKRYRFRVAVVGGELACPVTLTIDDHLVKIIAVDGGGVKPHEVESLVLGTGERVDFVLKTDRPNEGYFLKVKSCAGEGMALINYEGAGHDGRSSDLATEGRVFDTAVCESGIGKVCLEDVKSEEGFPDELRTVEKVAYLAFGPRIVNVNGKFSTRVYSVNNLTFTYPPSPLLTQLGQVSSSSVCDTLNPPRKCTNKDGVCECVHVEQIPLGSSTELVLINQDRAEHIFHLHGYRFHVVGFRRFDASPASEDVRLLNEQRTLLQRNFNNPIVKDTIRVPGNALVAVRFLANNPGFWMLRDEKSKGWTRGMDVVFQVGDSGDFVSAPEGFPTCGNYVGPDFFLM